MFELIGAIGWGLLACGAITHLWHQQRLRQLLALHFDREVPVAVALTAAEVTLALALPLLVIWELPGLRLAAFLALVLAAGFIIWIARLLTTGSELPCACSFSGTPTSIWSLARAVAVALVVLLAIAPDPTATASEHLVALTVGWAVAAAIFVLPEAITWPKTSKALLARVDAHTT